MIGARRVNRRGADGRAEGWTDMVRTGAHGVHICANQRRRYKRELESGGDVHGRKRERTGADLHVEWSGMVRIE